VDEQSVPENICTHATFDQLAEGARRFGVQPCLASAANASDDTGVLFLLIEGASWGISMAADLADPALDWDLRDYDDEKQRESTQAGLRRTLQMVEALLAQLPEHAPLRVAAAAWEANMQKFFQPWALHQMCSHSRHHGGEKRPCQELVDAGLMDASDLEQARQESLRDIKANDARNRERAAVKRKAMANGGAARGTSDEL
jgi:hypothetical protein